MPIHAWMLHSIYGDVSLYGLFQMQFWFGLATFVLQLPFYKVRVRDMQELRSFRDVSDNPTEAAVHELERSADVVIDTRACTPEDVLVKAATHLGLFAREYSRLVDVIVGGQYGSEGKGHISRSAALC